MRSPRFARVHHERAVRRFATTPRLRHEDRERKLLAELQEEIEDLRLIRRRALSWAVGHEEARPPGQTEPARALAHAARHAVRQVICAARGPGRPRGKPHGFPRACRRSSPDGAGERPRAPSLWRTGSSAGPAPGRRIRRRRGVPSLAPRSTARARARGRSARGPPPCRSPTPPRGHDPPGAMSNETPSTTRASCPGGRERDRQVPDGKERRGKPAAAISPTGARPTRALEDGVRFRPSCRKMITRKSVIRPRRIAPRPRPRPRLPISSTAAAYNAARSGRRALFVRRCSSPT